MSFQKKWRIFFKEILFIFFILFFFCNAQLEAAPTSVQQAITVVRNWLALEKSPMGSEFNASVLRTVEISSSNTPYYYLVFLNPKGAVLVPADDLVEPIIGFFPNATEYDPADTNPAGALIHKDVIGRISVVRDIGMSTTALKITAESYHAQKKWRMLEDEEKERTSEYTISDIRVAPLVGSTWSQSTVAGANCYNYYTPNNYVCGCVATAMAQLMRFHSFPVAGVGTQSFFIYVNGSLQTRSLLGGNGSGGAYDWNNMPLNPDSSISSTQRQAIGALTHDAGVSVNMNYTSSGSGTDTLQAANSFTAVFGYSQAIAGYNSGSNIPSVNLYAMVNPNLDAAYPVLFGITGALGGHAIVADGYGYNLGTMYHHLNMGWAGFDDAWYNLPLIEGSYADFNSVYKCVYNVFPSGTGEIVSGRVTADDGSGIAGVHVTLSGGASRSATTNAKGIYAFAGIPSGTSYTVSASKAGHTFTPSSRSVTTGISGYLTTTAGNVWQTDFLGTLTIQQSGAWVIGADGNTYRYEDGVWTWTPAKADYLSAVNKNVCWISQTGSSTLYKYDNGSWTWTPAKAKWVAAYGADSLWLVQATSDNLFMYEGGVWTWTPAKVKNISAPSSNVVWLIQRDSENLYKYTVSSNTWEWTPGKAKSISAATENVVWLVATNDHVYKYDHGAKSWTFHNIKAKSVSAVSSTEVMFVDMSGRLCRFNDGVVTVIGGSCKDVSVYPIPALSGEGAVASKGNSNSLTSSQKDLDRVGCSVGALAPASFLLLLPLLLLFSFFNENDTDNALPRYML